MPDDAGEPGRSVIDVAVQFMVGQCDGPTRALARHRRLPDGLCAGCLTRLTSWPCPAAHIALLALRQQHR